MTKPSPNAHLDVPSDRGDFGLFGVITSGCHGWLMLPASFPEDTKRRLCPHEMTELLHFASYDPLTLQQKRGVANR